MASNVMLLCEDDANNDDESEEEEIRDDIEGENTEDRG